MTRFDPWWEQFPGRLEYELEELKALGIVPVRDDTAWAGGVLTLTFVAPDSLTGAGDVELVATFPDFYPYLRPEVQAPAMELAHHQHPFGKNLCLIGRSTRYWEPNDTLAGIMTENLRTVLAAGAGTGVDPEDEEDQGEPFSDYYRGVYQANAVVLVDSDWNLGGASSGEVSLSVSGDLPTAPEGHTVIAVARIDDSTGTQVAALPHRVLSRFESAPQVQTRWVLLDEPVQATDIAVIWEAAEAADPEDAPAYWDEQRRLQIRLVAFPEEHRRNAQGLGWVLVVRVQPSVQANRKNRRSGDPRTRAALAWGEARYELIRAGRAGVRDMQARAVGADALAKMNIAILGCGAIGSVVADQLARAGVGKLTLIDSDYLEPGNLARHAATMAHVGLPKAAALAVHVLQGNPYLETESHHFAFGAATKHREEVALILDSVDLLIDATAEVAIQELSARLRAAAGKPWVMLEATNGGWGGAVVAIRAASPWCFACYEWQLGEGVIPRAPADTAAPIQPAGCAEPTFVAAQYDLAEVSLQAVRTAVQLLDDGQPGPADVAVVSMSSDGRRTPPVWTVASVQPHPSCTCGAKP